LSSVKQVRAVNNICLLTEAVRELWQKRNQVAKTTD